MPKDAPPNGGAWPEAIPVGPRRKVSEMQAKLHRWAVADPGRRFDDLFNLVHDPATLLAAFERVAGNTGSHTPGIDGLTVADVEEHVGVDGFLADLRAQLKTGSFRPLPVRERLIPKPGGSGKMRRLGIPTVTDRVVQAAVKLVLEPIFEADFLPVSYGFRPRRRAHDAIAEIHYFGTRAYRWVLDADIEAAFDNLDHVALMDRVRTRVKDKRVLALVKAFLKAGVLTELGSLRKSHAGTPQGGILSPLLFNIAMHALDEHLHRPWQQDGTMSTPARRVHRRRKGLPNWRLVRYADDFVILVHGTGDDVHALREEVAEVLARLGLRLSPSKTQVRHLSEAIDFLGFRLQWSRKHGTSQWYLYTFVSHAAIRSVRAKVRALTPRTSQHDLAKLLRRINQITHGWAAYFQHAVAQRTFDSLDHFTWCRLIRMLMVRHRWKWRDIRRRYVMPSGQWRPIAAGEIEWKRTAAIPITRYRYRGNTIGNPWVPGTT
ncbi:group II intron reverse transcriptase/maturase [Nonomuraea sp. NPDC050643]|uniref:group II intron reverse transcriptase/maturase n=1 Tax=Nonomuraea sp. NPDC050643 TaxID=3155660 RepID=UPI0033E0D301